MTASVNTESGAGFQPVANNDQMPSPQEQAVALESQLELTSYDPNTDPLLAETLPQMIADKGGVDPLVQASVLAAVGKKEFPLSLQYEQDGSVQIRSLGELADSRANEHAQQFIYLTAIKKILFGKYGIAKGKKLSSNIEVTYFRDRESGNLRDMVITSGRHRVTSIIALLQSMGVKKWRDQKVMVIVKIVNSDAEFAQLIETANDSRKMPRAEVQVHGLTKRGVRTANPTEFYQSLHLAGKNQYGHCFGKAVQFELVGQPQNVQDSLVSMVGSAWNKLYSLNKENRTALTALIVSEDSTALKNAARQIASNALTYAPKAAQEFPDDRVHVGAPKVCAIEMAKIFGVDCPNF